MTLKKWVYLPPGSVAFRVWWCLWLKMCVSNVFVPFWGSGACRLYIMWFLYAKVSILNQLFNFKKKQDKHTQLNSSYKRITIRLNNIISRNSEHSKWFIISSTENISQSQWEFYGVNVSNIVNEMAVKTNCDGVSRVPHHLYIYFQDDNLLETSHKLNFDLWHCQRSLWCAYIVQSVYQFYAWKNFNAIFIVLFAEWKKFVGDPTCCVCVCVVAFILSLKKYKYICNKCFWHVQPLYFNFTWNIQPICTKYVFISVLAQQVKSRNQNM